MVALVDWLARREPRDISVLAFLYGRNAGLLDREGAVNAEFDRLLRGKILSHPLAAMDRADRPLPLAARAGAEAVLRAIAAVSQSAPSREVQTWAPNAGADLASTLVLRPATEVGVFEFLWNRYAEELPELFEISGLDPGTQPSV